jgi:hypothetical protein
MQRFFERLRSIPKQTTIEEPSISQEELDGSGCVIRSLESILGVPLTPQQRNHRLSFVRKVSTPKYSDLFIEDNVLEVHRQDEENINSLLNLLESQPDTPSGQALSNFKYSKQRLTLNKMKGLINNGMEIILMAGFATTKELHATHIGNADGKNVILKSDGNIKYEVSSNKYSCLVFQRKK